MKPSLFSQSIEDRLNGGKVLLVLCLYQDSDQPDTLNVEVARGLSPELLVHDQKHIIQLGRERNGFCFSSVQVLSERLNECSIPHVGAIDPRSGPNSISTGLSLPLLDHLTPDGVRYDDLAVQTAQQL
jgi:hypothetical protein